MNSIVNCDHGEVNKVYKLRLFYRLEKMNVYFRLLQSGTYYICNVLRGYAIGKDYIYLYVCIVPYNMTYKRSPSLLHRQ